MEKVRVGVVGVGWIAQVVHLPILQKLPEAELVAICDRDKARVRLVAEKFGIKRTYTDLAAMLETEDLAAVIICTSTDAHRDTAILSLKAGKHVLVEKPIARTYAEAAAIVEAGREAKRLVMVGMNHRFRPDTMILRSFIEGKELGKVYYTKAGWLRKPPNNTGWVMQREKSGGGVFIDLGIVMLDMAFWMMGYPEVRRVSAFHFSSTSRGVEDTSVVSLVLKTNALINIEVSWSAGIDDDRYFCDVVGTQGTGSLSPFRVFKELHGSLVNLTPAKGDSPQSQFKKSYENELRHFLGAVRGLHPLISPGEEALQRMRIVDAVYKSVKAGKEITLAS
jgi:predicted dehydrogenase